MTDDNAAVGHSGAPVRRVPRHFAVLVISVGALGGPDLAVAASGQAPAAPEVVIEGRGFGHGVGMSQEGAYAMAAAGASLDDILETFYPGTSLGRRGGTVHVELLDTPRASVVVEFPGGGQVQEGAGDPSPGFPVDVSAGGSVQISFDGSSLRVSPLTAASIAPRPVTAATPAPSSTAPSTTTTVPSLLGIIPLPPGLVAPPSTTTTVAPPPAREWPSEPVSQRALTLTPNDGGSIGLPVFGRIYRGTMEARASGGGLQLVNSLDVEDYIRGMGEVLDPGWPAAALQAQAIAARTYALDAMAAGRPLCSSQQCQVYLGKSAEYAAMNRAVAETRGQVLTYGGALAEAVYSANTGGVTATPEEGFGMGADHPYLVVSRHPTNDPQPWEVRLTLEQLARRVGYPGQASGVSVTRVGPSGRALEITFNGDSGPFAVPGHRFMTQLDLRSTLFRLRTEGGGPPQPEAQPAAAAGASEALPARSPYAGTLRPLVFEAGGVGPPSLGRAPWTALSLLLLALWGVVAYARLPQGRRRTRDRSNASAV